MREIKVKIDVSDSKARVRLPGSLSGVGVYVANEHAKVTVDGMTSTCRVMVLSLTSRGTLSLKMDDWVVPYPWALEVEGNPLLACSVRGQIGSPHS